MARLLWFGLVLAAAVIGLAAANVYSPKLDVFTHGTPEQLNRVITLPERDLVALKFLHAQLQPPLDLGVFGNSRVVNLPVASLASGSAFNFAVPGTGFRQTVELLEALRRADRQPATVVVQLDNLDWPIPDNPVWSDRYGTWSAIARDVLAGLRDPSISTSELLRLALRYAKARVNAFTATFNIDRLAARWGVYFPSLPGPRSDLSFTRDGSRPHPPPLPAALTQRPAVANVLLAGYFAYDLRRLARLADPGHRVIVYESPLYPALARALSEHPSSKAGELRRQFTAICGDSRLECHLAAMPRETAAWVDMSHPDVSSLAAFVTSLLERDATALLQ